MTPTMRRAPRPCVAPPPPAIASPLTSVPFTGARASGANGGERCGARRAGLLPVGAPALCGRALSALGGAPARHGPRPRLGRGARHVVLPHQRPFEGVPQTLLPLHQGAPSLYFRASPPPQSDVSAQAATIFSANLDKRVTQIYTEGALPPYDFTAASVANIPSL